MLIRTLTKVASRYAPSRVLSFDMVHIFKALQLMENEGHISRALLTKELGLGEGAIKTLVKHLKMQNLIETSKSGTRMTQKGRAICSALVSAVPAETRLPKCSVALGKYNHAVLLKNLSFAVKSGIEQRDAAVKMGAIGATTLSFKDSKFVMPMDSSGYDSLEKEPNIRKLLVEKLKPEEEDIVIIGSANDSSRTAELAAKNAALVTLVNHEKHD
ncbi:hypothetical protein Ngar_c06680 [Candidatus Nitrososphaera gargensis Ga9.2]|uniref:DUF4443 domain-containing protein n=1 Tax=Nitrososphaera gargensis (strain Ga9.2) TaxID=1237085 RepID=K0I8K1_NITGG|nr:DUF4443 domain-containing protein [Candidatus Nitrososphaera gargensis]AFU57611.1 hypothetical protein Ngar_c06680 [Candidatus Nitrososphaera gargensis Ga9.2]